MQSSLKLQLEPLTISSSMLTKSRNHLLYLTLYLEQQLI